MLITLFVEAFNKEEAIKVSSAFIELAEIHNLKPSIVEIEDYWKFDDMFKAHLTATEPLENQLPNLLNKLLLSGWNYQMSCWLRKQWRTVSSI